MKLKINKACDLSSISVLPPHSRRTNVTSSGIESSTFAKSQGLQLRSQSQHSLSQGMSLSQLSQNSLDEFVANEQRFGSQERDNSLKRISSLPPINYQREESQMLVSRSSNSVARRWNSSSGDHRGQVSEELEHRIGLIETSLNRLGMVLDSVQSDVMQVNKSVKEVSLEMGSVQQKLVVHDSSLQLMLKGEEDIKTRLDGSLNSISNQLRKELEKYKLEETISCFSSFPDHIESRLVKLQNELCQSFSKEVAKMSSMKSPNEVPVIRAAKAKMSSMKSPNEVPVIHPAKRKSSCATRSPNSPLLMMNSSVPQKVQRSTPILETNEENLKLRKLRPSALNDTKPIMKTKMEEIPLVELEHDCQVIIESDEEIDGLSFLLGSKEIGIENYLIKDAEEETRRILRKARRRRRKPCNSIILD